ncbi:pyrroline-5-carboxylate reductase [Alkalibaculum sp. M08DMB]|uniref:Pyrroline-5-carboxylate reductase n=1 Tax=Alkalibaculum sporogenes TaxID=2655001 RepID=A0A6A7KBJ9_9FIRM|nr:pyrroline-5-carboxylate reductase [Alkalibaculum sporogenes]MPW26641.1 pyrroline-5-carboxylate reductase [Alkalibaculum sporogenes]
MDKKIGFIGCGNMAKAMIGGLIKKDFIHSSSIYASNPSLESLDEVKSSFGVHITQNNLVIAKECDIIFLSVKPYMYEKIIAQIKDEIKENVVIVMIAAGQKINQNEKRFNRKIKIARAMPNTPAFVGEAMTAICLNDMITNEEKNELKTIFECFGKLEFIEEKLMDVVTGVSGSSPAYAYMFIEALADAAVLHGMPRKQAYIFASQSVLGAAKMVLETNMHPGELKDAVCSPGGTTIEAVASLESSGFRHAVIEAVSTCVEKSKIL